MTKPNRGGTGTQTGTATGNQADRENRRRTRCSGEPEPKRTGQERSRDVGVGSSAVLGCIIAKISTIVLVGLAAAPSGERCFAC